MGITGTTAPELLTDINSTLRVKTKVNSITPTNHSDLLDNVVRVLSAATDTSIYVSSLTGDDSTGIVGSKRKAFKTIKAARDYGTGFTASTIYVMEGEYKNERNLQRNGNYYFEHNTHVYVKRGSDAGGTRNGFFMFYDTTQNAPYTTPISDATMNVYGDGNFYAEPSLDWLSNGWGYPMIWNGDTGSTVYFECNSIHHHTMAGAIRPQAGSTTVRIKDGIYGLPLSGAAADTGIAIQVGGTPSFDVKFDLTCPYMYTNARGVDIDRSGSGTVVSMNFGLIESNPSSTTQPTFQLQPSHYNDQGIYSFNVDTIVNPKAHGISSVDVESGTWNFDIGQMRTKWQNIYILNRGNIAATGDNALQMNFNVGQGITEESQCIDVYSLQNDARYYFNGNFRTLADNSYMVYINQNDSGLIQLDGTYINEGTGATAYGIYINAGETPPVLGDVKIYSKAASIAGVATPTVDVLGSAWFETAPSSAVTVTGNYTLDGKSYISDLNIANVGSGTSLTNLGWDASGNVVSGSTGSGYLEYVALLTQSGSGALAAPVANIKKNTLGATLTYEYIGVGIYKITSDISLFVEGSHAILTGGGTNGSYPVLWGYYDTDTTLYLEAYDMGNSFNSNPLTYADNILTNHLIEIKVWL